MSNGTPSEPSAPALPDLAQSIAAELLEPKNLLKLRKHAQEIGLEMGKDAVELGVKSAGDIAGWIAEQIIAATSLPGPIGDGLARAAMDTLLTGGGPRAQAGAEVGRRLIEKLAGSGGAVQPGYAGAAGFLGLVLTESIEAWLRGVLVEISSSWSIAGFSPGDGVDAFARLQDIVESMLGGGRLVRQVLGPIIRATAVTPAEWQTNITYRPELLGAGAAVEAFLSGQYSGSQLLEELARQGFSDERINVLVNNARKRLSFSDLVDQHFRGALSDLEVVRRAGELGYDQATATELLTLATARRRDRWKDPIVDGAVAAYIGRDIDDAELRRLVEANAPSYTEAQAIIDAARIRRELRVRQLSSDAERRLVFKEIRAVSDYRRALQREGYDLESITALELELRFDLDAAHDLEAARAAAAAERAAAEAERQRAAAERAGELAARRALPTLQEYRRGYVRGLIDRNTFAAAIVREKVAITPADLELLLIDADQARAAELERIEAAERARNKRPDPALSVSTLERAVLAGVLTLSEFDSRVAQLGYDDEERRTIVQLLRDTIEDRDEARRRRELAAAAAAEVKISLPDYERAVRLGLRTRAQYAALLDRLRTPEVSKALMLDLLDAEIAQDAAARKARAEREAAAAAGGISLGRRRRAVVAGVIPRAAYEAALIDARWPVDDQLAELGLLDLELAEAAARRARRNAIAAELEAKQQAAARAELEAAAVLEAPPPSATLTLGQVERAVKLGILPADALRAYVRDRGYSDEDAETIVALALAAVPDITAGKQLEPRVAAELAEKGISLADLKAATRRGLLSLDDYADSLAARGYGEDAIALMRRLLEEEAAIDVDGLRGKIRKVLEKADGAPPLDQVDAMFAGGQIDVAGVRELLASYGVPRDTALVYARLLLSFASEG